MGEITLGIEVLGLLAIAAILALGLLAIIIIGYVKHRAVKRLNDWLATQDRGPTRGQVRRWNWKRPPDDPDDIVL